MSAFILLNTSAKSEYSSGNTTAGFFGSIETLAVVCLPLSTTVIAPITWHISYIVSSSIRSCHLSMKTWTLSVSVMLKNLFSVTIAMSEGLSACVEMLRAQECIDAESVLFTWSWVLVRIGSSKTIPPSGQKKNVSRFQLIMDLAWSNHSFSRIISQPTMSAARNETFKEDVKSSKSLTSTLSRCTWWILSCPSSMTLSPEGTLLLSCRWNCFTMFCNIIFHTDPLSTRAFTGCCRVSIGILAMVHRCLVGWNWADSSKVTSTGPKNFAIFPCYC